MNATYHRHDEGDTCGCSAGEAVTLGYENVSVPFSALQIGLASAMVLLAAERLRSRRNLCLVENRDCKVY